MSSTNRGIQRNKDDYYYTPIQTIQDFWKKFCEIENKNIEDFSEILDPCAGGDENRPCAYPTALKLFEPDKQVTEIRFWTNDIREDSKAIYKRDFLTEHLGNYSLIISNPPFSLWERFVIKSLQDVDDNGYVIFLLRLNATGGQKRRIDFWNKYKPKGIYIHSKRPCFTKGSSDSCEYAHYVWRKVDCEETKFYWV